MPAIPQLILPPESMAWGRWMQDQVSELASQASMRAQGENMTNNTQAAITRSLQQLVGNLTAQVAAAIAANSYTQSQINSKVANPGNIAPGNVTASGNVTALGNISASGQVTSSGPIVSPGSHGYNVTTGYVACWINGDGTFGTSPSSGLVKKNLAQMTADDARRLLNLTPYWGHYVWDSDAAPLKVFFLAEDVRAAGFGPDVAPIVAGDVPLQMVSPDGTPLLGEDGTPVVVAAGDAYTVNYSQMVVPLVAAWHDGALQIQAMGAQIAAQQTQIDSLLARLTAAGIA